MKNIVLSAALIAATGFGGAAFADTKSKSNEPGKAGLALDPSRSPIERAGYVALAPSQVVGTTLTGVTVYDPNDGSVGQVSQYVMIDNQPGVVVDVGGYVGSGSKFVLLKMSDVDTLRATSGTDTRIYVPMTKDQLIAMPAYGN